MRAIVYSKHGGIDRLHEFDIAEPRPHPRRLVVEVHSIGLNPVDYRIRRGDFGPVCLLGPRVIGSDFAGRVVHVGDAVPGYSVGDRVFGMLGAPLFGLVVQSFAGTAAQRISIHPSNLAHSPNNVDDSTAATIPLAALTAYQALHELAPVAAGQRVLINGASGGVGSYATQIASLASAHVTGVTSARNTEWVRSLGANEVVDYATWDCAAPGAANAAFDVFFDCYGNRSFVEARAALGEEGVYLTTTLSARTFSWSFRNACRRQKSRVVLVKSRHARLDAIRRWVEAGQLRPMVQEVYPAHAFKEAYASLESRRTRGKIALRIQ